MTAAARLPNKLANFTEGDALFCDPARGASAGKMRCRTLGGADSRRARWGEWRGGAVAQNLASFLALVVLKMAS